MVPVNIRVVKRPVATANERWGFKNSFRSWMGMVTFPFNENKNNN